MSVFTKRAIKKAAKNGLNFRETTEAIREERLCGVHHNHSKRAGNCKPKKYYCEDCLNNDGSHLAWCTYQEKPKAFGCPKCHGQNIKKGKMADGNNPMIMYNYVDRYGMSPIDYRILYELGKRPLGKTATKLHFIIGSDISNTYEKLRKLIKLNIVTVYKIQSKGGKGCNGEVNVYRINRGNPIVGKLLREGVPTFTLPELSATFVGRDTTIAYTEKVMTTSARPASP